MLAPMSIATTPFQCRALRRGGEGGHRREVDGDERRGCQRSETALLRFEQKGFRLMRGQIGKKTIRSCCG